MSIGFAAAPALAACDDPPAGGRRWRWACWRSPEGQPAWARPALLGIAALAALLFGWNIASAGLAPFYSVAVKSMSESWKAFFYGAFDPQATITIDKLAGSFLPQALSARIFGYHPWSLALPQVIEGVVAVLVMYRMVRRWAGVTAGLLAAGLLALTPIAASMWGHSMEDGALIMCLVLAAGSWQRAVTSGRLRPLIWAGVWVGLGFQAKMLEAWMILPALAAGYLAAAPGRLRTRLWQLTVAGVVMLAVSLSWIALYTLTPAGSRPYVDGSTSNSAFAMVFGYNGLERFGITVPGAVTSGPGVTTGGGSGGFVPGRAGGFAAGGGVSGGTASGGAAAGGTAGGAAAGGPGGGAALGGPARGAGLSGAGEPGGLGAGRGGRLAGPAGPGGGAGGWAKLLGTRYGVQIGWLYPLALATLAAGLWWRRRAGRTDRVRAGLVMWGLWLLTFGVTYSAMSVIPHTAYLAALAPPLAALSGAGIVLCWRWYRSPGRRGWLAPAVVAAELAWAGYLWSAFPSFLPWLHWAALAAGLAAFMALVVARLSGQVRTRLAVAGLTAGVAAMLAGPVTWSGSVLDVAYAGTSFNASAGPSGGGPGGGGRAAGPFAGRFSGFPGRGRFGVGFPGGAGFPGAGGSGGRTPSGLPGSAGGTGNGARAAAGGGLPGPGSRTGAGGPGGGLLATATTTLTAAEQRIYGYVSAHRRGASYLMAVQSWSQASPYILATGQEVMPMGGFSGTVPEPALARVQQLVRTGQLRFFLLGGAGFRRGGSGTSQQVTQWVERSCTLVPAKDYGGSAGAGGAAVRGAGLAGAAGTGAAASESLYRCGGGAG